MRLLCMAGAYAGQVRDYEFTAGRSALATGTAVRVDAMAADVSAPAPVAKPEPRPVLYGKRRHQK